MALMRRLLALLVLLALVVAAPIALWLLGRDLLPSSVAHGLRRHGTR